MHCVSLGDAISAAKSLCSTLTQQGTRAVLTAYTTRPDHAAPEVARPDELIGVSEAIATDGHRWWSLTCDRDYCPSDGSPLPVQASVTTVTLVAGGLDTLPNRAALAAPIAPPTADRHAALADSYAAAEEGHRARTTGDQELVVTRFVDRYTATADAPTPDQLAALTVAINADLTLRDLAWARMNVTTATQHARLWPQRRPTHPPRPQRTRPQPLRLRLLAQRQRRGCRHRRRGTPGAPPRILPRPPSRRSS